MHYKLKNKTMRTIKILLFCCATVFSYAQEKKIFPKLSVAENKTLVELFPTTEQAQKFANQMSDTNGVAKIENVAIENGNLKLEKVANTLAFEKVAVSNEAQIDFVATNTIDVSETSMMPNNTGDVSLQIKGFEDNTLIEKLPTNESSATKVYPNPATVAVNILLSNSYKNNAIVFIYDAKGKLIYQQEITTSSTIINSTQWSTGSYWVKIKGNTTEETFTIIKK